MGVLIGVSVGSGAGAGRGEGDCNGPGIDSGAVVDIDGDVSVDTCT